MKQANCQAKWFKPVNEQPCSRLQSIIEQKAQLDENRFRFGPVVSHTSLCLPFGYRVSILAYATMLAAS